jgi:hypothetical protein
MKIVALAVLGLMAALALSPPALADTLDLSLANPTEFAPPGTVLSFTATVSTPLTNTGDVYLNADSTTVDSPLTLDDAPFFSNFPLFLAPGGSFTGVLFTVDVPLSAALNVAYNGSFEIDGGADNNAVDDLASVTFKVTAIATPEPSSVILLLTGLFGAAVVMGRKRRR